MKDNEVLCTICNKVCDIDKCSWKCDTGEPYTGTVVFKTFSRTYEITDYFRKLVNGAFKRIN